MQPPARRGKPNIEQTARAFAMSALFFLAAASAVLGVPRLDGVFLSLGSANANFTVAQWSAEFAAMAELDMESENVGASSYLPEMDAVPSGALSAPPVAPVSKVPAGDY